MQKQTANPHHTTKKRNRFWGLVMFLLVTVAALLFGLMVWLQGQIKESGYTPDTTAKQFVLGNDILEIPLNLLRFEQHRSKTVLKKAELAILWPRGDGYADNISASFQNIDGSNNLIFITLSKREMPFDMSNRLEPIYMKLFDGPSTSGPASLRFQKLKPGSGYAGEQLAIHVGDSDLWVARCQIETTHTSPTCLRDVFMGNGLSVRYRFPVRLLPDWRAVEKLISNKMTRMISQ